MYIRFLRGITFDFISYIIDVLFNCSLLLYVNILSVILLYYNISNINGMMSNCTALNV